MYIQILDVERGLNLLGHSKAQLKQKAQLPSQYKQSKATKLQCSKKAYTTEKVHNLLHKHQGVARIIPNGQHHLKH